MCVNKDTNLITMNQNLKDETCQWDKTDATIIN